LKLPVWLSKAWNAPPPGYRPGATLTRIAHDLSGLRSEVLTPTRWRFDQPGAAWQFEVEETVQAQFLLHIVTARFIMQVAHSVPGAARVEVRHRGAWRRTGLNWKIVHGDAAQLDPFMARVFADPPLHDALMALDFHALTLIQDERGWRVDVEPYAASEVVMRFPAMRRYVRLTREQAQHLLNALARLQGKLRAIATR